MAFTRFIILAFIVGFSKDPMFCQSRLLKGEYIVTMHRSELESRSSFAAPSYSTSKQLSIVPMHTMLIQFDTLRWNGSQIEAWLSQNPHISTYQANHEFSPRKLPDDPSFPSQYHLVNNAIESNDIDADKAWDITTGGKTFDGTDVVIAIVDNGINADHPDLQSNLWTNIHEIAGNGIDDDNNGYIDDVNGWSAETNNDNVNNKAGHGTQVAGVAGARGNNGVDVSGVMWQTKMMIVDYGSPTEAGAIAAYSYVYALRKQYNSTNGQQGAFVVASNSSWGRDRIKASEAPLWCAMYDSLGSVGVISCVATSNQNVDVDVQGDLPSSCTSPYMIAVNNITKNEVINGSTGYGYKSIDIGAYGSEILTLGITGTSSPSGTSVASPLVTGVLGLMYTTTCSSLVNLSKADPAKAARVGRDILLYSTIPVPSLEGITTTGGKLNAHRALINTLNLCQNCTQPVDVRFIADARTIKVDFDPSSVNDVIEIRIRPHNSQNWLIFANLKPGQLIPNLTLCTEYELQVKNKCSLANTDYSYSRYVQTNGCCNTPSINLRRADATTIELSWQKIEQDGIYIVEYRPINTDVYKAVSTSNNVIVINSLKPCQSYDFRIKLSCDLYGITSGYSEPIRISTTCGNCSTLPYCTFLQKNDSFEWIEKTKFGDINTTDQTLGMEGYIDYTGIQTASLGRGKLYPYSAQFKYKDDVVTPDYFRVYIDFDQSGTFDNGEEVTKLTGKIENSYTADITIPITAKLGFTKMRQMLMYDEFEGACDNGLFKFGEVEDFCIEIINANCQLSSSVSIEKIEMNSAQIVINGNEMDTTVFAYRKVGEQTYTEVATVLPKFLIEKLDSCAQYEYQWFMKCSNEFSSPSLPMKFTTKCASGTDQALPIVFTVFPNPATNLINIKSNQVFTEECTIQILNSIGHQMYNNNHVIDGSTTIDVERYQSGLYYLVLKDPRGILSRTKWIKL
jgi:serine protease